MSRRQSKDYTGAALSAKSKPDPGTSATAHLLAVSQPALCPVEALVPEPANALDLGDVKPMKSLVALMDDFRKIARSATQSSLRAGSTLGKHARTRTAATTAVASTPQACSSDRSRMAAESPSRMTSRELQLLSCSFRLPWKPSLLLSRLQDRVKKAVRTSEGRGSASSVHTISQTDEEERKAACSSRRGRQQPARPRAIVGGVISTVRPCRQVVLHLPPSPLPAWSVFSPVNLSNDMYNELSGLDICSPV
ncbi:hypothetical protein BD413DRAFT_534751 [Trametes elegans]|nr:hypothetical protein BD413DRAFT_534751 [Trametes elegans]